MLLYGLVIGTGLGGTKLAGGGIAINADEGAIGMLEARSSDTEGGGEAVGRTERVGT